MSEREWKPGDVAVASYDGEVKVYLRQRKGAFAGATDRWMSSDGTVSKAFGLADWHRLLVVIDPEDAEQVNRLADAFCAARWSHMPGSDECDPLTRSAMREALSEYLRPTPPRPDEPQGLGAVVEDAKGLNWIRIHPGGPAWVNGYQRWAEWSEVDAVRVVSPGVTS